MKMVYFEPKVLCCSGNRRILLRGDAADVNGAKMPPFHKAVNEEGRPGVIYLSCSLEEPVGSRYQQFCNSTRSGKNSFFGGKNIIPPSNSQGTKLKTLSVQTVVRGMLGSEVSWTDSNWEARLESHLVVTPVSDEQEIHH